MEACMKKEFFIVIFIFLTTTVFAQRTGTLLLTDFVYTSEGGFIITMSYEGKNAGQQIADQHSRNPNLTWIPRLSNGQLQVIQNLINRYQNVIGDTYAIVLIRNNTMIEVLVQMTSGTEYIFWAFRVEI